MNRYLTAALVTLAACAAEPTTSTSAYRCQTDPTTGHCKSTRDPGDATSVASGWVLDHYAGSTVNQIDCDRFYEPGTGRSGNSCATGFSWFGTDYAAICSFYDDGEIDCGVEEGD